MALFPGEHTTRKHTALLIHPATPQLSTKMGRSMMALLAPLPLLLLSSLCVLPQLAESQATSENVLVDLRPCIIAGGTIVSFGHALPTMLGR